MKPLVKLAAGMAIAAATLSLAATAPLGVRPTMAAALAVRPPVRRGIAPTLT